MGVPKNTTHHHINKHNMIKRHKVLQDNREEVEHEASPETEIKMDAVTIEQIITENEELYNANSMSMSMLNQLAQEHQQQKEVDEN